MTESQRAEMKARREQMMASMSADAKAAMQAMRTIWRDPTLSREDKRTKSAAYIVSLSPSIAAEIQQMRPWGGRRQGNRVGGGGGGFGGNNTPSPNFNSMPQSPPIGTNPQAATPQNGIVT